jgi:leucyl-tRNA synthetase
MSKSKGNTVDPQDLIDRYGADTVRLFIMFASPPEQSLEWSDDGVQGASRFLRRLWRIVHEHAGGAVGEIEPDRLSNAQRDLRRAVHVTMQKVSDDIGRRYTFNTAIAAVMELMNAVAKFKVDDAQDRAVVYEALDAAVLMLAPIVPHICHELWRVLGHETPVVDERWPVFDASALKVDTLQIIVQVNGKLRARIDVAADADKDVIEQAALADDNVRRFISEQPIRKVIVVPGKLVNVVV